MASLSSRPQPQRQHKQACTLCARRKIKCDRSDQCSNCTRSKVQCTYDALDLNITRPRKRTAAQDLVARLARCEHLLRTHNIDPNEPCRLDSESAPDPTPEPNRTAVLRQTDLPISPNTTNYTPNTDYSTLMKPCSWSTLTPALKYPAYQQSLLDRDLRCLRLNSILQPPEPALGDIHPEPKLIYRLWQIFVERVNPVTKVIHVPTLQQRVLDASWGMKDAPKPLVAVLFAIYTLAVAATTSNDCRTLLGESRDTLMARYRTATWRALMEADFLITRDLEVLQALVLFLFADPDAELASNLSGAAVRIAQKLGLFRNKANLQISFFQRELQTRLAWLLIGTENRLRSISHPGMRLGISESELTGIRLPLNVNDADLHPEMSEPPAEHNGPTEMLMVLMKCRVFDWHRSLPKAGMSFDTVDNGRLEERSSTLESRHIDELEAVFNEEFLRHLDTSIPFHDLSSVMAKAFLARTRFLTHHPRLKEPSADRHVYASTEESDLVFNSAIEWLELLEVAMNTKFFITYLSGKCKVDAYIYILSELRQRFSGKDVHRAWKLVENLYNRSPHLFEPSEDGDIPPLNSLTLEAWGCYTRHNETSPEAGESDMTPDFIQRLQGAVRWEEGSMQSSLGSLLLDPGGDLSFAEQMVGDWEAWPEIWNM